MIVWQSTHDALRREYDDLKTASERQIRDLRAEAESLRSRTDRAETERTAAYQKLCDFLAKRSGLGTIFGPDGGVPARPFEDAEPITQAVSGRAAMEEQIAKFEEEVLAFEHAGD